MTLRFPTAAEVRKRELIAELLDESLVSIQLDPRRDGVDVPAAYRDQPALCLNLSHSFHLDVFEIGRFSIEASLSFGGARYHCVLPYSSIYSIECTALERHYFFPEDVPVELDIGPLKTVMDDTQASDDGLDAEPGKRAEHVSTIDEDSSGDSGAGASQAGSHPHLRLIK